MTAGADELQLALQALWKAGPLHWDKLYAMPEFEAVKTICVRRFGLRDDRLGVQSALGDALQAAGAPFLISREGGVWNDDLADAAKTIDHAFRQTQATVRYICPLNLADDLPSLSFGNAEIRRFTVTELRDLFQEARLKHYTWINAVNWDKYAEFQWLVVTDVLLLPENPGERSIPILYQRFDKDFGAIDPHEPQFPAALDAVIFFLAAAPWQDWVSWTDFDWHPFKIPWHYTTSTDLLDRPRQPQSHDTLAWEPYIFPDNDGQEVEIERPIVHPLAQSEDIASTFTEAAWSMCQRARTSPVFAPPVAHFLIKGFMGDGIEEFLAHITTIEASLGAGSDHVMKGRKGQRHEKLRATARVAARVAGLLGKAAAEDDFKVLFKIRSEYLHGAWTGPIPSEKRVLARQMAQRVVGRLIAHGASSDGGIPREQFLSNMLDAGSPNT